MAVLGERRDGHVGDVVGIDEGLAHVADRQGHLAGEHASSKKLSLKFWVNQLARRMVQSAPGASALLGRAAPRPRRGPDSSTSR